MYRYIVFRVVSMSLQDLGNKAKYISVGTSLSYDLNGEGKPAYKPGRNAMIFVKF